MGIPFYYKTLITKYKNITSSSKPITDIFCFDYNGLIHPIVNETNDMKDFHHNLWKKTTELIQYINPSDHTFIAVDGVAPLAKIHQQRKRRYLKTLQDTKSFDTNNITCGTPFMNQLMQFLLSKQSNNIKISTTSENGEGEHKIINYFQNIHHNKTIVIHGLDADLILLSILNSKQNLDIYLMREHYNSVTFLSISKLIQAIILEWTHVFPQNTIHNYCYIMSILGNDFLPHPIGINIKNNGINQLKNSCKNCNPVQNKKDLQTIFHNIADIENSIVDKKNYYKDIVYIQDIPSACKLFLDGIEWTYKYYNKEINHIDHGWYYPYYGAPMLKDIANHSLVYEYSPLNNLENFISNEQQLLIVIPIHSKSVLPEHLQNAIEKNKWMYPKKFKLITFMKQHEWEYVPILPTIDISLITF